MSELHIAEIPYESGALQCRYARYLSEDGTRWVRHGLYQAYYPSGVLKSEGTYEHGLESGEWRDFHENGQLAALGRYEDGVEVGDWKFWDPSGKQEDSATY